MNVLYLLKAGDLPRRNTIEHVDFANLQRGEGGFVAGHGLLDDRLRAARSRAGVARREDDLVGRVGGDRVRAVLIGGCAGRRNLQHGLGANVHAAKMHRDRVVAGDRNAAEERGEIGAVKRGAGRGHREQESRKRVGGDAVGSCALSLSDKSRPLSSRLNSPNGEW